MVSYHKSACEVPDWKRFVKAGRAVFTVRNDQTGNRLTFKVNKCDGKDLWFVSVLSGPDNERYYGYLGCLFGDEFRRTAKSRIGEDALSCRAFRWLSGLLQSGKDLPDHVHVYHEGRCGRCGRRLTVPQSIEQGFGPECIHLVSEDSR